MQMAKLNWIRIGSLSNYFAIMAVMYWSFKSGNSLSIIGVTNLLSQLFRQTQRDGFVRGQLNLTSSLYVTASTHAFV